MKPSKNLTLISLLLSLFLVVTGCIGCSSAETEGKTKIDIVTAANFSEWTSTYAIRNGILTSNEVEMTVTCAQKFNDQIIAGNFKMGEMSTATYAIAYENGQRDYKVLSGLAVDRGTEESIGTNLLFTTVGSDIESPADLIGKTVGVPGLQSSSTSTFLSFLKSEYGITQDQLVLVDKASSILLELLRQGELDASLIAQNVAPQAYYDTDFRVIWNLNTEFEQRYGENCIPTIIVVDSEFYEENKEAVQAAYELLKESNQYAEERLEELAELYIDEFSTGLTTDFYMKIHRYHSMAGFLPMNGTNRNCVMAIFELLEENGVITQVPADEDIFLD